MNIVILRNRLYLTIYFAMDVKTDLIVFLFFHLSINRTQFLGAISEGAMAGRSGGRLGAFIEQ